MKHRNIVIGSFLLTAIIWAVFSWPLPRYMSEGIPATYKAEQIPYRDMMPGDHLQLMYHFWMFQDMAAGQSPWFHNVYEFNEGDDAARYEPGTYFFPFSGVYAIFAAIGGRAFGWNMTGIFSLWLTLYFTWLFLRRWTDSGILALLFSCLTLMFPYRWVTLFGGSPTGFAMAAVPLLFLGLDIAIRDRKASGGVLAGLSIFFACWTDTHVFFFATIASPFIALLCLIRDESFRLREKSHYLAFLKSLWPFPLLVAAAFGINTTISSGIEEAEHQTRTIEDVWPFTPDWPGLFLQNNYTAPDNHIYVGWLCVTILLISAVLIAVVIWKARKHALRESILFTLLGIGIVLTVLSALGPKEPLLEGRLWTLTRKLIPPYEMVRQTDKVFALLPTLLAFTLVLATEAARKHLKIKSAYLGFAALVAVVALAVDFNRQTSPAISGVRESHPVYEAVASDAEKAGKDPRVIILTIWPGESHYGSIYMHYSSLHRIRMINGYTPFPSQRYVKDVFKFYEPMNMGYVTDEHLNRLQASGFDYILVHENLFEEKVSAFPVAHTLHRLLNHPRLTLLMSDEGVWGFRIHAEAQTKEALKDHWTFFMPARRWETEGLDREGVVMTTNSATGGAGYLTMADAGSWIATHPTGLAETENLFWWLRVRGSGQITASMTANGDSLALGAHAISSEDWSWLRIPASGIPRYDNWRLRIENIDGRPEVDLIFVMAGEWNPPKTGESISIPPALFFHGGSTHFENDHVTLQPENEIEAIRLYGPKLPLAPGEYVLTMKYDVPPSTPIQTLAGEVDVRWVDHIESDLQPVFAPDFASYQFTQTNNLPVNFCFIYKRTLPMTITDIELKRIR